MLVGPSPSTIVSSPARSPDSTVAETLPPELYAFCRELEAWVEANQKDARMDTLRFWSLKIPAVLSSAFSGILALAHLGTVSAALAAAASACVLIDAVHPGGQLRNAHLRAVHDLRDIQHQVLNEWRIGKLKGKPLDLLAASALESAEKSRDKVVKDLRTAETTFGGKQK